MYSKRSTNNDYVPPSPRRSYKLQSKLTDNLDISKIIDHDFKNLIEKEYPQSPSNDYYYQRIKVKNLPLAPLRLPQTQKASRSLEPYINQKMINSINKQELPPPKIIEVFRHNQPEPSSELKKLLTIARLKAEIYENKARRLKDQQLNLKIKNKDAQMNDSRINKSQIEQHQNQYLPDYFDTIFFKKPTKLPKQYKYSKNSQYYTQSNL